ncbi:Clathrin interactor EPSIN 2 [Linum grandiflorum]
MKKVFDQTVRDLKREVNKKVLKVPGIEQKVLDATSNEPWGPHGSLLADIAQATRNYHEYQMIMSIIWKRINDTGKNWRHVYKGLTVLEYLVAHGSERVIDDIKEHAYQISTLSEFQYIDSSGRDQGSNVRKKSQNLVALVNDKERIIEVRQKAAANRERFRSPSAGGMHRPGSNSGGGYGERYDDDRYEGRYGNRDEERNGYGRERESNYRDDDRYGRYGDSYNRDGNRDEERYGRDGYRDDGYRGRSRSNDGYGSRGRSSDRERGNDEDGQYSARPLERKFSEQNIGAPPSYEEAVNEAGSPAHSEKNRETSVPSGPVDSSPPAPQSSSSPAPQFSSSPAPQASQSTSSNAFNEASGFSSSVSPANQEVLVDEFDPRGGFVAFPTSSAAPTTSTAPTTANNAEMDLLGSLSESFGPLAIVPASSPTTTSEPNSQPNHSAPSFASTQPPPTFSQGFEDPFGDNPFKAVPSTPEQPNPSVSAAAFQNSVNQYAEVPHAPAPNTEMDKNSPFGDTTSTMSYSAPDFQSTPTTSQFLPQELSSSNHETDILADILPPSGPSGPAPQAGLPAQTGQTPFPVGNVYGNFNPQTGSAVPAAPNMAPPSSQFSSGNGSFLPQGVSMGPTSGFATQSGYGAPAAYQIPHQMTAGPSGQLNNGTGSMSPQAAASFGPPGPTAQHNPGVLGGGFAQGASAPFTSQPGQSLASQPSLSSSTGALVPVSQPSKDKFETKSTVWADTLSRGLVNLNISGSKTNPLADIGVDFDAINRKEKRMSKPTTTTTNVASTVTMGKAMGSGSGIGRAGATAIRPQPSNMMMAPGSGMGMGMGMAGGPGSGMGMGMGAGSGPGMGMGGGYGRMAQPGGMGMGNMQQPPRGLPQQGPPMSMPGGYNNMMMGGGGYPQQSYGRGFQ